MPSFTLQHCLPLSFIQAKVSCDHIPQMGIGTQKTILTHYKRLISTYLPSLSYQCTVFSPSLLQPPFASWHSTQTSSHRSIALWPLWTGSPPHPWRGYTGLSTQAYWQSCNRNRNQHYQMISAR